MAALTSESISMSDHSRAPIRRRSLSTDGDAGERLMAERDEQLSPPKQDPQHPQQHEAPEQQQQQGGDVDLSFGKQHVAEMDAAFLLWFEGSIVYLQVGVTLVASHLLVALRSATDGTANLLAVWLAGMSICVGLLLRHHKRYLFRDIDHLLPYLDASSCICVACIFMIAHGTLILSIEDRTEVVINAMQRMQRRPQLLALGWGLTGMLIGTLDLTPPRGQRLLLCIALRIAQHCYIASKTTPARGLEFLATSTLTVLGPMLFGFLAVKPYKWLARKLWAQSESRLQALRSQLEQLEGHIDVVESYRRQELTKKKQLDLIEQRVQQERERRHLANKEGGTSRRRLRPQGKAPDAALPPLSEADAPTEPATQSG